MDTLVIGYGNTLRSDDGAGPEVARCLAELGLPGVEILMAHQLLPEHAEMMSHYPRVVFVDACADLSLREVEMLRVEASDDPNLDPHASDPGALLALSMRLFDGDSEAWLVRIPCESFELGEELSHTVQEAIPAAISRICCLCQE